MLFNRLLSLAALLSVASQVLTAPLPVLPSVEVESAGSEVELECEPGKPSKSGKCEVEVEFENSLGEVEIETEISNPTPYSTRMRLTRRQDPACSLASLVLSAQQKLDVLKPLIEQAMAGPLGSIEKSVGAQMTSVHEAVSALEAKMDSCANADEQILHRSADGTFQLADTELAKPYSVFLLDISDIEEMVKHVSGFTVTSAQQNIRKDLLSMKTTLGKIVPAVLTNVASTISMALSVGTGAGVIA